MIHYPIEKVGLRDSRGVRVEITKDRLVEAVSRDAGITSDGKLVIIGDKAFTSGELKTLYGALRTAEERLKLSFEDAVRYLEVSKAGGFDISVRDVSPEGNTEEYGISNFESFDFTRYFSTFPYPVPKKVMH